ncbi:hypothetical protein ElyMa_003132000 [Elysia marginata]|uniref:Uncharacterized protein n=1 Tax=Elysia marginata TaxID=1093978 RepID=A0AAV4ISY4_9GAST|nr:hypothetical protein ElyMa_003132000 [Elysia marginata]
MDTKTYKLTRQRQSRQTRKPRIKLRTATKTSHTPDSQINHGRKFHRRMVEPVVREDDWKRHSKQTRKPRIKLRTATKTSHSSVQHIKIIVKKQNSTRQLQRKEQSYNIPSHNATFASEFPPLSEKS